MRFLGVDLAWGQGSDDRPANRSGVAALDVHGKVLDAGWTRGVDETVDWIARSSRKARDVLCFVDAPLVINNEAGQRRCETEVGQRYGRYWVSANSTNLHSKRKAGTNLLSRLERAGWKYDDGVDGPPREGKRVSECYPYTTLIAAAEFGLPLHRPPYKRRPRAIPASDFPTARAAAFRSIVGHLTALQDADPPLDLSSDDTARTLLDEPPVASPAYKEQEDLLDAVICAWTAAYWFRHGLDRCDVLGASDPNGPRRATIIAPRRLDPTPLEPSPPYVGP